jgi:hypothetical protein
VTTRHREHTQEIYVKASGTLVSCSGLVDTFDEHVTPPDWADWEGQA